MLKDIIKSYSLAFLIFLITGFISLFSFWVFLERSACVDHIREEINRLQTSLNQSDYDIAYDNISFNSFSVSRAITVENLRVYSLDASNYFEWDIPALVINPSILDPKKVTLNFGKTQSLKTATENYALTSPNIRAILHFRKNVGLNKIELSTKNIDIKNFARIGELNFAAQRMGYQQISELTPFFENILEARNIKLSDNINHKIPKDIDHLFLNANIIGQMKQAKTYQESASEWLKLGGVVDIKKMTISWEPLNLVGKGDLFFNDNKEPTLQINTSSKGLAEFLDYLQEAELIDSKGSFVAKILLNNKAFYLNENDQYKTVTTPIVINNKEVTIENISIKTF